MLKTVACRISVASLVLTFYFYITFSFRISIPGTNCLIGALAIFAFGIYVFINAKKNKVNQAFFILSLTAAGYLVTLYFIYCAGAYGIDNFKYLIRIFRNGNLLIPSAMIYFCVVFTSKKRRFWKFIPTASIASMLPFIILNAFGLYINSYEKLGEKLIPAAQHTEMYRMVSIISIFWIILSIGLVFWEYFKTREGIRRKQFRIFFVGLVIAVVPGLLAFLPAFRIKWFPPFIGITSTLFPLILGFAVIKFSLFDIKIIIRRTLPYAVGTGIIGLIYACVLELLHIISQHHNISVRGTELIALFVFTGLAFEPILTWLKTALDKMFFRKELEIDSFIANAGEKYTKLKTVDELAENIIHDIKKLFEPEDAIVSFNNKNTNLLLSITGNQNTSEFCTKNKTNDLKAGYYKLDALPSDIPHKQIKIIKKWKDSGFKIFYSFSSIDNIGGFLLLKEKKSHTEYSGKDELVISALASHVESGLSKLSAQENALETYRLNMLIIESLPNALALLNENKSIILSNNPFKSHFYENENLIIKIISDNKTIDLNIIEFTLGKRVYIASVKKFKNIQNHTHILAVISDVTKIKKLQESDRRRQSLAELGTAISSINHEIQNILSPIDYYLNKLIKDKTHSASTVEKVISRFHMLGNFSTELKEYYRPQSLHPAEITVSSLVQSVTSDISGTIKEKWIMPEIIGGDYKIIADPQKMKQVFMNIMNNSWQAMCESKNFSWQIITTIEDNRINIRFKDSGSGIKNENLDKIFTPFFSTKNNDGTGLGLAIAKQIVLAHNGNLSATSDNNGTIISITLPAANNYCLRDQSATPTAPMHHKDATL